MMRVVHSRVFLAAISLVLIFPFLAHAQTGDLSATIRGQLMSDPRTATLSSAQIDAMVQLLAQEAQKRGLTASDITWKPQTFAGAPTAPAAQDSACTSALTCAFTEAFGFVGPDTAIPFILGATSMALIWILAEMMHRRKYSHVPAPQAGPAGSV